MQGNTYSVFDGKRTITIPDSILQLYIGERSMSRVKSEIELKVEEMKIQIKADLDTYIKGCVSLQKNAVNYDNMILENAIQQIECLKNEVDRLI